MHPDEFPKLTLRERLSHSRNTWSLFFSLCKETFVAFILSKGPKMNTGNSQMLKAAHEFIMEVNRTNCLLPVSVHDKLAALRAEVSKAISERETTG